MKLSKNDSDALKGAAILLMVFHHLFGFPERFPRAVQYEQVFVLGVPTVTLLASFGKLCVAIFLLLSGYGLAVSSATNFGLAVWTKRVWTFLKFYWFSLVCLLGFAIAAGKWLNAQRQYEFTVGEVTQNLLCLHPTYSNEWWFVGVYLFCIAVAWPLAHALRGKPAVLASISLGLWVGSFFSNHFTNILLWQPCFVAGFFLPHLNLPIWNDPRLKRHVFKLLLLSSITVLMIAVALARTNSGLAFDALFGTLVVVSLHVGIRLSGAGGVLSFLGRLSGHMWLNHTFFFYYLWPHAFYGSNSFLLTFLLAVSASVSFALLTSWLLSLMERSWLTDMERRGVVLFRSFFPVAAIASPDVRPASASAADFLRGR